MTDAITLERERGSPDAVQISKHQMKAPDREPVRRVIEEEGVLFTPRLRSPEALAVLAGFIKQH